MIRRLKYWLESRERGRALQEELEFHLAERTADLEARGMSPARARLEARRRFGSVARASEDSREIWLTRFASELAQDLRYGCRALAANKPFTALAVLSLALGIGANTTIYSFMESILLRTLPVADPGSLVVLNWQSRPPQNANKEWVHVMHGVQGMAWPGGKGAMVSGMFPLGAFESLRQNSPVFSSVFGYFNGLNRGLAVRGQAATVATEFVTGQYFHGLSVSPAAGRLIDSSDDHPGAPPVAVLSFAVSQQRFGGPSHAIGQQVRVDNAPFTVIGVTPPEFFGVDPASMPGIYLPLRTLLLVDNALAPRMFSDNNFYWIEMMGRLRPGVSMAQAQAALAPGFHQWVAATASTDGERANLPALQLNPGAGGLGGLRRQYAKPLFVLFALVGLILAIACANIANLLLARAASRRREMAVRLSLGAGRFRIIRQLLTESVVLASLGGALGVLFAVWGVRALTLLFSNGQENFTLHADLNSTVLAATAALSLLCGLLFGLVPALQSTRPDVLPSLKSGAADAPRQRARNLLVIVQVALSFLILFTAGLFVRTLNNLHSVQLGYARENILLFSLNARQAGHRHPATAGFYENLRQRLASVPGVAAATFAQSSIVNAPRTGPATKGPLKFGAVTIEGARSLAAGPGFLSTMQIPLLTGREIDTRDQPGSAPVAVITETLARAYFPDGNPVGRRISLPEERRELEIVGVAANLRYGSLKHGEETAMAVFVPAAQFPQDRITYALRTTGDPLRFVSTVRELVREADSRIPVTNVTTQATEIDRTISREITFARLCSGFAVLALLIACVGLYGAMSYNVSRQIGELGIRMALGAPSGAVVWMVLRRALILAAAGLACSIPAALAASRLLKSLLFGIQPNDPFALLFAAALLLAAALLAGYLPARRAARIDPLAALRQE